MLSKIKLVNFPPGGMAALMLSQEKLEKESSRGTEEVCVRFDS